MIPMAKCKLHRLNFLNFEPRSINCLKFNEENKKLALLREDCSIEVWNFNQTPYLEVVLPAQSGNSIEDISWCGVRLFSTGLTTYVVEHDLISLKQKHKVPLIGGSAWCLSANKTNNLLAAGTEEGYVCLLQVQDDGLSYLRKFDKQEGRILCLSWHSSGESVATGSVDVIRIWNVETGHVITRIAVGRMKKKVETIVWSILYLSDHTVVSGDSWGRTSFWDGQMGTLKSGTRVHKADVLTLCASKDENIIYSSGIDPIIVQFSKVNTSSRRSESKENRELWVKSVQLVSHTHDIRSLALINEFVLSGGVDCNLTLTKGPPKVSFKYAPINYQKCFRLAPVARCVLIQYPTSIEVWKLGHTSESSENDGDMLRLSVSESKALFLKCREGEQIICSAISNDSRLIAYASTERVQIYSFLLEEDPVTQIPTAVLNKIKMVDGISSAQAMRFTSSGKYLLLATENNILEVLEMNFIQPYLFHTFSETGVGGRINLLECSANERFCASSDHAGNITVYDLEKKLIWSTLPRYKFQATSMIFCPHTENLIVVYQDGNVIEYDILNKCYSKRSKVLKYIDKKFDKQYPIINLTFDLNDPNKIYFQDENTVYVYNFKQSKVKSSPKKNKKNDRKEQNSEKSVEPLLITACKKFKHLLAFTSLSKDEIVALELSPDQILQSLPLALKKKKFGT